MTYHEARVAFAQKIADDIVHNLPIINSLDTIANPTSYIEEVHNAWLDKMLDPFFKSNDICHAKVQVLRDKDHFYPMLRAIVIPSELASKEHTLMRRRCNENN